MKLRLVPVILALVLLAACAANAGPSPTPSPLCDPQTELTVAAAADLQFAFTDIAALFEAQTGCRVTLVFGSTGQLTQQIENGAPYDLLAAADTAYIQRLAEQDLVLDESIALYARGHLVLAVNRQSGLAVDDLADLLEAQIGRIAIADPAHAPYGAAAQQALESVGIWAAVQDKLVLGETVRQALQYVQTGDAPVGIVALSVANVPEITWTLLDETLHQPLDQSLAVVAGSPNAGLAAQFAQFINSETARLIMRQYGFILPGEQPILTPTLVP